MDVPAKNGDIRHEEGDIDQAWPLVEENRLPQETDIKETAILTSLANTASGGEATVMFEDDEDIHPEKKAKVANKATFYGVDDRPPWYFSALLGLQHYLIVISGSLSYPFALFPALCIREEDPARGYLISTIFFISGLGTFIQTSLGIRLPIVQGCSVTFLVPILATMSLPEWRCPSAEDLVAARSPTVNVTGPPTDDEWTEVWQARLREISGAIIVSALFEVVLGFTGIVGFFLRWMTPLGITPFIALVGLSLFEEAARLGSGNWGACSMSIILMVLFSQYFTNINVPVPYWERKKGFTVKYIGIFKLFPILLAILISWGACHLMTSTEYLPLGDPGRTDIRASIIEKSPWIRVPYPGQFGLPTVSVGMVLGMLSAILASVVESVGDYYACARLSHVPPPPTHAINRGIWMEGIGCILAGFWGGGCGLTSYSTNISIIAVTKVACRSVVQWAALYMILGGVIGKIGALFATIPDPIIGGVFSVMFAMIAAVGLSIAQNVDLNSSRNLFVLGSSLFFGMMISNWTSQHPEAIQTGNKIMDQTIVILLSTSMFVGGVIGIFLDNTIPGTPEERGLVGHTHGHGHGSEEPHTGKDCYDLPFLRARVQNTAFAYLPISPSFSNAVLLEKITPKFVRSLSRKSKESVPAPDR
ncbi:solute carrier family 23 member 1-like [Ornithodoros turicata]